jgi:hypothetical protein
MGLAIFSVNSDSPWSLKGQSVASGHSAGFARRDSSTRLGSAVPPVGLM